MRATLKKFQQLFSRQSAESETLAGRLQEHRSTHAAMMEEYKKLDQICIQLAARMLPEQTAGSPRAAITLAELRLARWRRDAVKAAWSREEQAIQNPLLGIATPHIWGFKNRCLDRLKNLPKEFQAVPTGEKFTMESGKRDARIPCIEIETNWQAVEKARQMILAAMHSITDFQLRPLRELQAEIERLEAEFDAFEFDETTKVEMPESSYRLAKRDAGPEPNPAGERINELSGRIARLEKSL